MSFLQSIISLVTRKKPLSGVPYVVSSPMLGRIISEYKAAFGRRWPRSQDIEKLPFVKEVKTSPPEEHLQTVLHLLQHYRQRPVTIDYQDDAMIRSVMGVLFARHLPLKKEDAQYFADFLIAERERVYLYPYLQMLSAIARFGEEYNEQEFVSEIFLTFKSKIHRNEVLSKIAKLEAKTAQGVGKMTVASDVFGEFLQDRAKNEAVCAVVTDLVVLAASAQSANPPAKFIARARELESTYGTSLHEVVHELLSFFLTVQLTTSELKTYERYQYTVVQVLLKELSISTVKGLCWIAGSCTQWNAIQDLIAVALHAFKKVPAHGPAISSIGNACIVACALQGRQGVKGLSVIQHKLKTNKQAVKLVLKQLQQLAESLKVSIHQLQEGAVDDYGFVAGKREVLFPDAGKVVTTVTAPSTIDVQWFNSQGKEVSGVPDAVKKNYAERLKEEKRLQKEISDLFVVHAGRFDSFYLENRSWCFAEWKDQYAPHGIFSFFISRLIWQVKDISDRWVSAWWSSDHFVEISGKKIDVTNDGEIKLWHPIFESVEGVMAWRSFILDKKVVQPIKQAFREVYVVTDAERQTKSYSNRMAAHIVRQHQFSALAKQRNWNYTLRGWWDNTDSPIARRDLPAFKMTAEFWVEDIDSYATNATSSGIMTYVTTDQVRFYQGGVQIDIEQVHPLVFSEVMRDVDLFVGVASIGNDPDWQDQGGEQRFRTYWENFSFGALSESAKVRKTLLESIIPSLAIASVCHIEGNYVVVKGTYNTYKIHIGSSNIMMEPGNRYLCIVPSRGDSDIKSTVFLPFEGDRTLSLIISKALLLARDTEITDGTITRQLRR